MDAAAAAAGYAGLVTYKVTPEIFWPEKPLYMACCIYHPNEPYRVVKNEHEAAELGVCYRDATADETARTGAQKVWDFRDPGQSANGWRPQPYPKDLKFDPLKAGPGKTFQPAPVNPAAAQNAMVEALIPQVAAAVAQALKLAGPGAPASVDAKQWDEFLAFQAWQKTQEVVKSEGVVLNAFTEALGDPPGLVGGNVAYVEDGHEESEFAAWRAEAEAKGIKVDKRWGLARLKEEVEKAA